MTRTFSVRVDASSYDVTDMAATLHRALAAASIPVVHVSEDTGMQWASSPGAVEIAADAYPPVRSGK